MSDSADSPPGPVPQGPFEIAMRGYSRSQVDDFVADTRQRVRDLEDRLSSALGEAEQLRAELAAASQPAAARPAHVEVSERIAQILKLADEEAQEQKTRAAEEITGLRALAQRQVDTIRQEARDRVEQMLASAQDQADRTTASARAEAAAASTTARAEAERLASEAHRQAEAVLGGATAQARRVMEEATARAGAIHDSAETRVIELTAGHADLMRRLTEIRDIITDLAARDAARGSLPDEVDTMAAAALAATPAASQDIAALGIRETADRPAAPETAAPIPQQPGGDVPPTEPTG